MGVRKAPDHTPTRRCLEKTPTSLKSVHKVKPYGHLHSYGLGTLLSTLFLNPSPKTATGCLFFF